MVAPPTTASKPSAPPPASESAAALARRVPTARDFDDDSGAPLLEALMAAPRQPSQLGLAAGAKPVFQVAAVLVVLTIAASVCGRHVMPAGWVRLFDNLHWSIADVGAAWLAWLGVRDARRQGLEAEFAARRWFARGFTSYAIGQMLWNLQVVLEWHPFPAPSDPFYAMLAPCCAIGMMGYLSGRVNASQRLAAVLDTLSLGVSVVALALVAYLPQRGEITPLALGVMIAYPTLLLSACCIGLMLAALMRVGRGWSVWTLVLMLGAHGALWMAWNSMLLRGQLSDGDPVGATFSAFTIVGGLAASAWRVRSATDTRIERFYEGALRLLPLAVVVGVTLAVALQGAIATLSSSARMLCDAAAVLVIVLAACRQTLLLRDRDQLFEAQRQLRHREDELRELNQHLEQRVLERTHEVEQRNAELSTAMARLSVAQDEIVHAEKLAGLGALVAGVAEEMSASLGSARMVASTLPTQVEALGRRRAPSDVPQRPSIARDLEALDESHRQLAQSLDQAQRVIAGFQQLAVDQTSGRRRAFDLLAGVREVVDLTRLSHRHDPIEILVTGEAGLVIDSYPGPIGQVLAQLLDNAVTHGLGGRHEGLVEVRVWPTGRDAVRITVRDDGAGIAPADLPQVFAPFFTTGAVRAGSGLGLTICRNIVTGVLGGRIEIVSPPDAGTTVTVTLPRVAPRAAA